VIEELKQVRKDVRFIIRPIPFQEVAEEKAPYIAIAAGFQGKFEEFNKAFLEYPEEKIPDDFIKETAELYGLDYDQLIKDSEGEKVEDILTHGMNAMQHAAINSVPSFIIKNKIYIVTNDGIPDLKQLLNIIPTSKN
jgi:predicted DsbA family dithiol-disulfide isomerase